MSLVSQLFERRASPYVTAFLNGDEMPNAWGPNGEVTWGTADFALRVATVYTCVRVVAEDISTLPLPVFRRLPDGGKERAYDHPLYGLIHDAPNPEMSKVNWMAALIGHVELWGNHYSQIVRNGRDVPIELWPLRPDRMAILRDRSGDLVYRYKKQRGEANVRGDVGESVDFPARDILHVRNFSSNGLLGYSTIQLMSQPINLAYTSETYGQSVFNAGGTPSGVITVKKRLSEEAMKRLRVDWEAIHANQRRVAFLEEDMAWQSVGMPASDISYVETRKMGREEIAGIFRVPPHKVGILDRATYANVSAMSREYVRSSIRPRINNIEAELTRQLIPDREHFVEFNIDGMMEGDPEAQSLLWAAGRQWGFLSANDIRSWMGLNPVDGGDVMLVPLNMIPAERVGEQLDVDTPGRDSANEKVGAGGLGGRRTMPRELMERVEGRIDQLEDLMLSGNGNGRH